MVIQNMDSDRKKQFSQSAGDMGTGKPTDVHDGPLMREMPKSDGL